jgi:hypothetical protein
MRSVSMDDNSDCPGVSVSANVHRIDVFSNCARTTMNPTVVILRLMALHKLPRRMRMQEKRFGGVTPDSFQDQDS